jgi:hypothetical protein
VAREHPAIAALVARRRRLEHGVALRHIGVGDVEREGAAFAAQEHAKPHNCLGSDSCLQIVTRQHYSRAPEEHPMQTYRLDLTKQRLAAMPATERQALLLLGHATNEINLFQKLTMMVRKEDAHTIVTRCENGQILILMRALIGKLHEAWELFKKRIQADAELRTKYLDKLSPEARARVERLNQHFGSGSPLTAIRNQLAFHYTDKTERVEDSFQHLAETEAWEFYLSETVGNSFYWASELVITVGAIRLVNPHAQGGHEPFAPLADITIDVAGDMTGLFHELIADLVESMGDDLEAVGVEVGKVAKISHLPFFFDEDDLRRLTAA